MFKQMRTAVPLVVVILATLLFVSGCGGGGSDGSGNSGDAGNGNAGAGAPSTNLATLGIDPLGRGAGFDLTESNYAGRCYQDDALEASRPRPPDQRAVAADEAEAVARASQAAADVARNALDAAERNLEASFAAQAAAPPMDRSLAGVAYLSALATARGATQEAYEIGLVLLAEDKGTTWRDVLSDPNKLIQSYGEWFIDNSGFNFDDETGLGQIFTDLVAKAVKAKILGLLKDARDVALAKYNEQYAKMTPVAMEPVADPAAQQAFVAAQANYDAAQRKLVADSALALEARIFVDAPSDLPPCDADELAQALKDAFCTGAFVNPITPAEEAAFPGITETLNTYIAKVCAAVS